MLQPFKRGDLIKHVFPALFWSVLIGLLILLPGQQMPKHQGNVDKLIHGFVFFLTTYLWLVGLKKQRSRPVLRKLALVISLGICLVYGTLLEVCQVLFIKGRMFEVGDLVANYSGGIIGVLVFFLIYGKTVTAK